MTPAAARIQPLTGKQRRHLRALAHDQKPVLQIGHAGLTRGVLQAIEVALETHELIKLKILQECPDDAATLGPRIEQGTRSQLAQVIGRTLVLYRRRRENPKITLPAATKAKPKPKTAKSRERD